MTTCDHGIRLDRFCGDCESGFVFRADDEAAHPRLRLLAAVSLIVAVALVFAVRSYR